MQSVTNTFWVTSPNRQFLWFGASRYYKMYSVWIILTSPNEYLLDRGLGLVAKGTDCKCFTTIKQTTIHITSLIIVIWNIIQWHAVSCNEHAVVCWNLHMPGVEIYTFGVNVVLIVCWNLCITAYGKNWNPQIA